MYVPSLLQFRYGPRKTFTNPSVFRGHLNKVGRNWNAAIHRAVSSFDGIHVMDEDWDNLIVLDACRHDAFAEVIDDYNLGGSLRRETSLASGTYRFMTRNFEGREFHDTIYVCANAYVSQLDNGIFHDKIDVWKAGLDPEYGTVLPDRVNTETLAAAENHPNKRLIAHYLQPHEPFIGEKGLAIREEYDLVGHEDELDEFGEGGYLLYHAIEHGLVDVPLERIREAYRENLRVALAHVADLLEELDGKTVVTSDHGELLGERLSPIPVRGFGHHYSLRSPGLVHVPWYAIESDDRRRIVSEPPVTSADAAKAQEQAKAQLRQLGYTE